MSFVRFLAREHDVQGVAKQMPRTRPDLISFLSRFSTPGAPRSNSAPCCVSQIKLLNANFRKALLMPLVPPKKIQKQ